MSKSWMPPQGEYISTDGITVGNTNTVLTNYTLPLTKGGTGATTASAARSNLGLGYLATKSNVTSWITSTSVNVTGSISVSDGAKTLSANATKAGWYPLGIVGINGSGDYSTYVPLLRFYLTNQKTGSCTANVSVRNFHPSKTATPTFTVYILWTITT